MGKLTNSFLVLLTAAAAFLAAPIVEAQNTIDPLAMSSSASAAITAFQGAGVTNPVQGLNSNLVWFCTSTRAAGVPRILTMGGVQTDLAAGVLTAYSSTNSVSITNAGIAGTNVLYCPTTGFASNDLAIIQFYASDTYQLVVVTNVGTGNLGISAGAKLATVPQSTGVTADRIFKLTSTGTIPVSILTNFPNASWPASVFATGREGAPLALVMTYSNAATLRTITGDYWRQPRP